MKEFTSYFVPGLSALLPLINPPGTALEMLSVVGIREPQPYKVLERKVAVNTTLFLALVALAGPYDLQFFGISIEVLQPVGGAVLAAMGWHPLIFPITAGPGSVTVILTLSAQAKSLDFGTCIPAFLGLAVCPSIERE